MPPIVPKQPIESLTGDEKALMDMLLDRLVSRLVEDRKRPGCPLKEIKEDRIRPTVIGLIDTGHIKPFLHDDQAIEWMVWDPMCDRYMPLFGRPLREPPTRN